MEQEYGEPSSATSLAARTVLPGAPFDPPAASAVPGPREVAPQPEPQAFEAPPQWNFGPPAQGGFTAPPPSFEPASYDPTYGDPNTADPHHAPPAAAFQPTYATAESLTAPDQLDSLHQFGAMPVTESYESQFPAPQAAASAPAYPAPYENAAPAYPAAEFVPAYPAPAEPAPTAMPEQGFPGQAMPGQAGPGQIHPGHVMSPAYPAAAGPSWPAAAQPIASHEAFGAPGQGLLGLPTHLVAEPTSGEDAEGAHRKSHPRPNKALLVLAAVVVLGGGGYFAYTQLSKSNTDTSSSIPVTAIKPTTPAKTTPAVIPSTTVGYAYPSHLAGFALRSGASAAALQRQITSFSKGAYPTYMGSPTVASFGTAATASVVAVTFHPTAGKLAPSFATILDGVRRPATNNTVGAFTSVPPGAAGGSMTCGSQTGASPITYCVFEGKSAVGMIYMKGAPQTANAQALTREMRAFAEH